MKIKGEHGTYTFPNFEAELDVSYFFTGTEEFKEGKGMTMRLQIIPEGPFESLDQIVIADRYLK